jgi:hypothetical protein
MVSSPMRLASCPSRWLSLVCKIPLSLLGLSETNTIGYIWIVYLGSVCEKDQWRPIIHRRKRCDLSLFQLGIRFLEHLLNEDMSIPVQFHVTI